MAKNQKSFKQQQAELRKLYVEGGYDEDFIEKQLAAAAAALVEPARDAVLQEMLKCARGVSKSPVVQDNIEILKGSTIAVYIDITRDGKIDVRDRTVTKRKRSSSSGSTGGSRPTLVDKDGDEHASWADLCRKFDLNIGGDSAKRVWERAHEAEPEKYPMPTIKKND